MLAKGITPWVTLFHWDLPAGARRSRRLARARGTRCLRPGTPTRWCARFGRPGQALDHAQRDHLLYPARLRPGRQGPRNFGNAGGHQPDLPPCAPLPRPGRAGRARPRRTRGDGRADRQLRDSGAGHRDRRRHRRRAGLVHREKRAPARADVHRPLLRGLPAAVRGGPPERGQGGFRSHRAAHGLFGTEHLHRRFRARGQAGQTRRHSLPAGISAHELPVAQHHAAGHLLGHAPGARGVRPQKKSTSPKTVAATTTNRSSTARCSTCTGATWCATTSWNCAAPSATGCP